MSWTKLIVVSTTETRGGW